MAIVLNPTTRTSVSIVPTNLSQSSLVVNKGTSGTLQSLTNVVTTDLQDGYTLVYDSDTSKWVAQPASSAVAAVDGGTY